MFPILKCACCGVVRPFHDDPEFPDTTGQVMKRHHLTVEPKDAYHCTCDHCHGSQFWAIRRHAIARAFREAHGVSQNPQPNCTICSDCAIEVTTRNNGLIGAFFHCTERSLSLCLETAVLLFFRVLSSIFSHALWQLFVPV